MDKHFCIFEFNKVTKKHKFLDDFGIDFDTADMMCQSMNNFRTSAMPIYFFIRCLTRDEFDNIDNYQPFVSSITFKSVAL